MNGRVAIAGVGQTVYKRRHADKNSGELVREAVVKALDDAGLDMDAIGLVIGGVAPDALAGLNHMDLMAIARPGIPYFRVNTGGATGSSAVLAAISWIASGRCDAVLVVALERMGHASTSQKVFNSIFDPIYEKDISVTTISMVAMRATMLMQDQGYELRHWAELTAKNSRAALRNDTIDRKRRVTAEEVLASPVLAWPIHQLEACPMSEGACAVVLTAEHLAKDRNVAWVHGAAGLSDTYAMGDRMHRAEGSLIELYTLMESARRAYRQAGISRPAQEIDCVEIHAPFSSAEAMAYTALGLVGDGTGPQFADRLIDGSERIVVNPSGGPQMVNPVSAAALVRIAECALQVRGLAGERQEDGIGRAVATGQGGATQFSTCVVMGADKP
ncbi:thiolase family protein [Sphingobium aquiterrae]|uniref:thiolase family protein n=1 Tax=Sphingobium aquiterrae TaxID=2038656 RepID=UPI003016BC45